MAKINIEVDTEEKVINVTIDGEKIENANYASVYSYKDYNGENRISASVSVSEKGENGVEKSTSYYAYASKEAAAAGATQASKFKGLVVAPSRDVMTDLQNFFQSKPL